MVPVAATRGYPTIGIDVSLIFKKMIGNGTDTRFWMDNWVGEGLLKLSFPRLYRLDTNQQCVVSDRAPTFHKHHARTSDRTATVTPVIGSQIGPSASQVGLVYNWSWLRLIRTRPDLAEHEDLCSLVAHLRLYLNQDIWECTIDNLRTFTVKGSLLGSISITGVSILIVFGALYVMLQLRLKIISSPNVNYPYRPGIVS
nr:RNA-directed DNA polymerase, eukaryota, reverse transcriptase zinc-binding domain protein [Tanacetum cinerariifolium]